MGIEDLRPLALSLHVAAGMAALVLASKVLAAGREQDWSSRWGGAYVGCVLLVAGSAVALTVRGSALPAVVRVVLLAVALITAAAAVRGLQLARPAAAGSSPECRPQQLRWSWGSVTSLVSAVAVVSAPLVVWAAVVVVGTSVTEWGYRRAQRELVRT